jgi:hypothetical protein
VTKLPRQDPSFCNHTGLAFDFPVKARCHVYVWPRRLLSPAPAILHAYVGGEGSLSTKCQQDENSRLRTNRVAN